jgi:hypothetical protein
MMIPHVFIIAIDMLSNNVFSACGCITLPICSHLVNALCFALPTVLFTLSFNLPLPQIAPLSRLMFKQNFK